MRLNDALITEFEFEEQNYQINLSFDVVLDALDYMKDDDLTFDDRISIAVDSLLGELPDVNLLELWSFILKEFITFESEKKVEVDIAGNPVPVSKQDEYIDLEKDAEFIFASFLQAYGMNLIQQQGILTWIEFRALLKGLPQNTIMQQIIQIRQWEPYKGVSKEERQRMFELKRQYSLREEEDDG